jgi:hypothetical protein
MDGLTRCPGAVAGAADELARPRSSELRQHQIDGLGRDVQQLGPERHRHPRPRQEQLDHPGSRELLRHSLITRFITSRASEISLFS